MRVRGEAQYRLLHAAPPVRIAWINRRQHNLACAVSVEAVAVEADVECVHSSLHRRTLHDLDVDCLARHFRLIVRLSRLLARPALRASRRNLVVEARSNLESFAARLKWHRDLKVVLRVLPHNLVLASFEAKHGELSAEARNRGDSPPRYEFRYAKRQRIGHVEVSAFPVRDRM